MVPSHPAGRVPRWHDVAPKVVSRESKGQRMSFGNEPGFDKLLSRFGPNVPVSRGQVSCRRDGAPPLPAGFAEDESDESAAPIGTGTGASAQGESKREMAGTAKVPKGKSDEVEIGPWFKSPKGFYSSGLALRLRPSDHAVYFALLYRLNKSRERASNRVTLSDVELSKECGVKPRTIRECRTRLCEAGAMSTSPGRRGKWYTYTLPPLSLEDVPISDRQQRKWQPRANYAKRKPSAA